MNSTKRGDSRPRLSAEHNSAFATHHDSRTKILGSLGFIYRRDDDSELRDLVSGRSQVLVDGIFQFFYGGFEVSGISRGGDLRAKANYSLLGGGQRRHHRMMPNIAVESHT